MSPAARRAWTRSDSGAVTRSRQRQDATARRATANAATLAAMEARANAAAADAARAMRLAIEQ